MSLWRLLMDELIGRASPAFASPFYRHPLESSARARCELILRKLSEGATEADLLDAYPRLTREDIQAAIGYAADTVAHEETVVVEPARGRSRKHTKR